MVAAGAVWWAGSGGTAADAPAEPCSDAGAACAAVEDDGPVGFVPGVRDAADVCPASGYLCAELNTPGSLHVRRWRPVSGPVVVHVPPPPLRDRGAARRLQRAAAAGIRAWNEHPFPILVDERGTRPAHFAVGWARSLGGNRIGRAQVRWTAAEGLTVVGLQLATHDPQRGRLLDAAQIRLTAAHEMGHALGLPHSDSERDVMYPQNTASALTARDYRTLEALYGLPDGTEIVAR